MITQHAFPVEPWAVRETSFDLSLVAQAESIFALSNGHIGLRGNLDEGEPYGIPGTYLNSFYESRPLPYAEAGFGYPEDGQTVVDVTNGKLIRLLVEDEPFDVRYGELRSHERRLDLRAGTLERDADWVSPAGQRVLVHTTRMVSLTQRAVAAICYEVTAPDERLRITLQSELVANEPQPRQSADPRVAAALEAPLESLEHEADGPHAILLHRTRSSGLLMGAAMFHEVDVPGRVEVETRSWPDVARTTVTCILKPGETLRLVKFISYGWSSLRSTAAVRDQVGGALTGARYVGWDGLLKGQRDYLDGFWEAADVEVDGDPDMQQAVRFGLFHVLQSAVRAERRCLPAKGLTGPGYDGHAFWDTEGFVLPVLTYTVPGAAADALRWRWSTLDLARERAGSLGLRGATFPWRTIRGQECSAYWPSGTAAWHVNADVADAFERYRVVTGDETLERDAGLEVLVETARLWLSIGHHDREGGWHLDGVTGPDEYSALADDNVFTNLMAARNLRAAADACGRHPARGRDLGVTSEEAAAWRDAAAAVAVPWDPDLRVHQQAARFTSHAEWDFAAHRSEYPLLLHQPYVTLYRVQVLKQADLMLALHWCGDHFTDEEKARDVDYYERRTVRDSSLSACTQAVMCAEVGHLELAHDYAYEAAFVDLRDLHDNGRDGLHMASLAGTWIALVAGFGGLRDHGGVLRLDPHLPEGITRLVFRLHWGGRPLTVEVTQTEVVYSLREGTEGSVTFQHAGEELTVTAGPPVRRPVLRRVPLLPRPPQPAGREPIRRHAGDDPPRRGPSDR